MRSSLILALFPVMLLAQNNGASLGWYGAADPLGLVDASATFAAAVAACNGELDIPATPVNGGYLVGTPVAAWPATPCTVVMRNGAVMSTGFPPADSIHKVTLQSSMPIIPPAGLPGIEVNRLSLATPLGIGSGGTGQDHTTGGIISLASATGAINTTETLVIGAAVPANTVSSLTTYRITAYGFGTASAANVSSFRLRFGTTGTSADTALLTFGPTSATSGTNVPFKIECLVTFQSTTAAISSCDLENNGTTGIFTNYAAAAIAGSPVTIATNVANILQFSYQSAATTTSANFGLALEELVKP